MTAMSTVDANSIFGAFESSCRRNPEKTIFLYEKADENYTGLSYKTLYESSTHLASTLFNNFNVVKGTHVALIDENGPAWAIAFLALMRLGAVIIPFPPHFESFELKQLLYHSESKLVLVSHVTAESTEKILHSLSIPSLNLDDHIDLTSPSTDIAANALPPVSAVTSTDIAVLIYTSGTTGTPKGVLLSHLNILSNVNSIIKLKLITENDCLGCLLPFHHTYPLMVNLILPLILGAKTCLLSQHNLGALFSLIKANGITVLIGVPRLFSFLHEKIDEQIKSLSSLKRPLLNNLLHASAFIRGFTNINLSLLVFHKLHTSLGAQFRCMISAGAKLDAHVAADLYLWGFTICEGYGLTETSPVVAFNAPNDLKLGTVGRPTPGVVVTIENPDETNCGEILVQGDNVFCGYYKDPEATQEALKDGWLHTRDIGYLGNDGLLRVTGRKNETLVLSNGKKIFPESLENLYLKCPSVKEICIFLTTSKRGLDLLTAVIYPNYEYFINKEFSLIKDEIKEELQKQSAGLPAYKRIQKLIFADAPFPRTSLGKIKRFEVKAKYTVNKQTL